MQYECLCLQPEIVGHNCCSEMVRHPLTRGKHHVCLGLFVCCDNLIPPSVVTTFGNSRQVTSSNWTAKQLGTAHWLPSHSVAYLLTNRYTHMFTHLLARLFRSTHWLRSRSVTYCHTHWLRCCSHIKHESIQPHSSHPSQYIRGTPLPVY